MEKFDSFMLELYRVESKGRLFVLDSISANKCSPFLKTAIGWKIDPGQKVPPFLLVIYDPFHQG